MGGQPGQARAKFPRDCEDFVGERNFGVAKLGSDIRVLTFERMQEDRLELLDGMRVFVFPRPPPE